MYALGLQLTAAACTYGSIIPLPGEFERKLRLRRTIPQLSAALLVDHAAALLSACRASLKVPAVVPLYRSTTPVQCVFCM
ncbi:hypothetical protein [Paenibacillus sp. BIHB 4019]|uniref:hypothetical protein n=1 Tax=Paenibacillus sp. BIHB 4019 TaxID=1870819 RepID=UPI0012370B2C|nr:hypothetical protein [Paenibacillus sp. BIHB 4019]